MLPLTKPLSDCQLSMGLALSLGHPLDDIHITKKQRCMVMVWNSARTFKYYREFDYRDWRIAGPVATFKTLFPKLCRGRWILWLDGALGWICHHRECSPLDPEWVRRDRNVQLQREAAQRQLNDAIAFRDNYGVGELDELIEQLQEYLK